MCIDILLLCHPKIGGAKDDRVLGWSARSADHPNPKIGGTGILPA